MLGERKYLVDEAVGIKSHTKMSSDVAVKVIDSAVGGSYRLSGEKAVNTEAVHNNAKINICVRRN